MGFSLEFARKVAHLMNPEDAARYAAAQEPAPAAAVELDPRSYRTGNTEAWEQRQFAAWLKEKQLLPPAVWHSVSKRSTGTVGCPDFIVPVAGSVL